MSQLIYQWIDLLWLPIGLLVAHKGHRLMTFCYILACILTLRTQVELMESFGLGNGILRLIDADLYSRGLAVYSVIIALFLVLAYFSKETIKVVYFAALLSSYIFALCISMLVMAL